jgi:alkylated DNA nucleotide flippase Atl1
VRRYLAELEDSVRNLRTLVPDLGDEAPTASELTRLLSRPEREFPTDDKIREELKGKLYRKRVTRPVTYILKCLERDYGSPEPVDMSAADVDIEHVLPQRPSQPWTDLLTSDASGDESADDIHAMLVHTLGNLTLTAQNRKLGNRPFDEKRTLLADSGFAMNREIARHDRWGRPEIEARGAMLTNRVLSIWPGPQESPVPVADAGAPPPRAGAAQTSPVPAVPAQPTAAQATTAPAVPFPIIVHAGVPQAAPARAVPAPRAARRRPPHRKLRRIVAAIPAGRWTSFASLGLAVSMDPRTLPAVLFGGDYPNAHRVLKKNGTPSEVFRWREPGQTASQRDVLTAEGVRFNRGGTANADQYVDADDPPSSADLSPVRRRPSAHLSQWRAHSPPSRSCL